MIKTAPRYETLDLTNPAQAKSITDALNTLNPLTEAGIWATGSLAAGHGTPQSDIDIHIAIPTTGFRILAEQLYVEDPARLVTTITSDGRAFDVEAFNADILEQCLDSLAAADLKDSNKSVTFQRFSTQLSNQSLLDCFHRISTGIPIRNQLLSTALQDRIRQSRYLVYRSLYCIVQGENVYNDIVGFLDIGDITSAILHCRELTALSAEATIYINGVSIDRRKWIPWALRQRECQTDTLSQAYWRLCDDGEALKAHSSGFVDQVLQHFDLVSQHILDISGAVK